ncbi:MAG: hypothetical protein KDA29_14570 [Phycisphaerales bacterium]|nr:hypothetical protein [Phycisphaerales bacterium]
MAGVTGTRGGDFDTGYARVGEQWVIFANLGASRTGHDYHNRFVDDGLEWFGKTRSSPSDRPIAAMTSGATVHLFTRDADRDPWMYAGTVVPARPPSGSNPVKVVWRVVADSDDSIVPSAGELLPDESEFVEGAMRQVLVDQYERNPAARRACIAHWGARCYCCDLSLCELYGEVANGFIHVHHVRKISTRGQAYKVDPVRDLRPLCPNCHAIVPLHEPPTDVDELRSVLRDRLTGGPLA